jgi:hypothetical protein
LIILPVAFLLSAFLPAAVTIILLLGGLYLAYEGGEKVYEYLVPHKHHKEELAMVEVTEAEILAMEKDKIKSAILTDFILSIEIVIIALGTVVKEPITTQIVVVSLIAIIATVGVYGIVALIVRMDEFGTKLIGLNKNEKSLMNRVGNFLVQALPKVIKSLALIGTIALILVAGGIFVHNVDFFHYFLPQLPSILQEFVVGLIIGLLMLFLVKGVQWLWKKIRKRD